MISNSAGPLHVHGLITTAASFAGRQLNLAIEIMQAAHFYSCAAASALQRLPLATAELKGIGEEIPISKAARMSDSVAGEPLLCRCLRRATVSSGDAIAALHEPPKMSGWSFEVA